MAVANPYLNKEWEEWKREMEENRRRRWRDRVGRCTQVEVSDLEDEEDEEETDDTDSEEEEEREDEEENEEEEDKMKLREVAETEEEGDNEMLRRFNEIKDVVGQQDRETAEEDESVDLVEQEDENKAEWKENEEVVADEGKEVMEAKQEQMEGQNEFENEVQGGEELHEQEDKWVREEEQFEMEDDEEEEDWEQERIRQNQLSEEFTEHMRSTRQEDKPVNEKDDLLDSVESEDEDEENGAPLRENEEEGLKKPEKLQKGEEEEEGGAEQESMKNKRGGEEEESDIKEANDMEEEGEDEVESDVMENGEVESNQEKGVMEADKVEEEELESEMETGVEEDRWLRVEEQDDDDEEHWEQENIRQNYLGEQFRENMRGIEDVNFHLNQESMRPEDETDSEEENLSDSLEFEDVMKDEDKVCEKQYQDQEEVEHPNENGILEAQTSMERRVKGDESEKLRGEKKTGPVSCTTQEEFHEDDEDDERLLGEEEDSTEDEGAELSADDDTDNDEDVVKIYHKENYLTELFHTLTEFRDSLILTDLTLMLEDGKSFHVHGLVMAAVSCLIRESLSKSNAENTIVDGIEVHDTSVGVHRWSVALGPEVDHVGLEAVVEFAYTGLISCLNKDTLHQIKAAAHTLGASRVLDLCTEEGEKSTKTGGVTGEGGISTVEQMTISLQSIKQLWMDRQGCDVILKALRGSFHVHRVILAVWSDFFRSMFTLGMKESNQPSVTLPFILASELEVLIGCSYSGTLPLSWKCVFEITSTALQLQCQPALSLCLSYLQQEINPHFCLDVASFAEAYDMAKLLEVADDFVLRQFQKVACTPKFRDLPAKQLLKYLHSQSLCVPSEIVVFKAVVAWIQAKPKRRLRLAKELMKTIHFPLMTFKEFKEVQSLNMWSDHNLAELYEAIFEDFCSSETAPQSQYRTYLPKESLVLIGGDYTSEDLGSRSISKELWFGNSLRNHMGIKKAMEWRRLAEMPDPPRFSHEVTVLQGKLYVIGGKMYYGINDTLNSVYRYDPIQNSWETLAEMQEKRCSFSVVVLDGKIYAIGGHCDPDYIESVEQYCPITNSWSYTQPLDLPLSAHVAKVVQGQIFVSGGLSSNYQCLSSMFLYHPQRGCTYLANMFNPRAHHCMETLGECLYVAGGITTDHNNTIVDHLACEVYNPVANSWTAFTSLPVPHVGAGSAVLEGKFYVLGGYSQEDYSDTKMVHRFDPTTQIWENMGKMPGPNNDIRASLLCLPTHFRL